MSLSVSHIVSIAKQHQIDELGRLTARAELAGGIGHLIHALQSERGASSIYLASSGQRFGAIRRELVEASCASECAVRSSFDAQLTNGPGFGNAKIFSLMAWALLGLDTMPQLRVQIGARKLTAHEAVAAFSRLIGGLISLVFELADTAVDPGISRLLVAYFNFIQGKEQAGQERATGALCYASGRCDGAHQQRVLHLIDAQERSFQVFAEFADPRAVSSWRDVQNAPCMTELERLRRMLAGTRPGARLDANQSDAWFECCSQRLAKMWEVQRLLVEILQERCQLLIADAQRDQFDAEGLLRSLRETPPPTTGLDDRFFDPDIPVDHALAFVPHGAISGQSAASMVQMLQAQSERLARIESELDSTRRALNERKSIERAKGMLMARLGMSEEEAYVTLRKTAMNQKRRLVDVAESALSMLDVIGPEPPADR